MDLSSDVVHRGEQRGQQTESTGYAAAVAARGGLLFVSGQTPEGPDGSAPAGAEEQLRQIWRNVEKVLAAAGTSLDAIIHVRTFLASRRHRDLSSRIRREVLGSHEPALTVIICELYEAGWVGEIEVVAELPVRDARPRDGG